MIEILTFYEFKRLSNLPDIRQRLLTEMRRADVKGTIILAEEGFNATICGASGSLKEFLPFAETLLKSRSFNIKRSHHSTPPFRKTEVKIKPEVVTLKQKVDIELGRGTHVEPEAWNDVISDPDVVLLDTRNAYEVRNGTFRNAIDPGTEKFSDLPQYVSANLDPARHKKVAMFCTGGIRCEKVAPYLRSFGFEEVYQLRGGILKYLEQVPREASLWEGECFVFDERVTVDSTLRKGTGVDHSLVMKTSGETE